MTGSGAAFIGRATVLSHLPEVHVGTSEAVQMSSGPLLQQDRWHADREPLGRPAFPFLAPKSSKQPVCRGDEDAGRKLLQHQEKQVRNCTVHYTAG